jgi:hypothetical protein
MKRRPRAEPSHSAGASAMGVALRGLPRLAVYVRSESDSTAAAVAVLKVSRSWRAAGGRLANWVASVQAEHLPDLLQRASALQLSDNDGQGITTCAGFYGARAGAEEIRVPAALLDPTLDVGDVLDFDIVGLDRRDNSEVERFSPPFEWKENPREDERALLAFHTIRTYALRVRVVTDVGEAVGRLPIAVFGVAVFVGAGTRCRAPPYLRAAIAEPMAVAVPLTSVYMSGAPASAPNVLLPTSTPIIPPEPSVREPATMIVPSPVETPKPPSSAPSASASGLVAGPATGVAPGASLPLSPQPSANDPNVALKTAAAKMAEANKMIADMQAKITCVVPGRARLRFEADG